MREPAAHPSSMHLVSWEEPAPARVRLTQTPTARQAKISLLAEQACGRLRVDNFTAARWERCMGPECEPGASVSIQSLS